MYDVLIALMLININLMHMYLTDALPYKKQQILFVRP